MFYFEIVIYILKVAGVKNRITFKKGDVPSIFTDSKKQKSGLILNILKYDINYTEPFRKQLFIEKVPKLVL